MDRRRRRSRQLLGRHRDQDLHAEPPERNAARGTRNRQHYSLGEKLSHDPRVTGTERRTNGQLAVTAGRAHQQQVGDVGARDQQDHDHAGLKQVQRPAHVADELIAERDRVTAEAAGFGERRADRETLDVPVDDDLELRVGLGNRGAGFQARHHLTELVAARAVRHLLRRERERHEQRNLRCEQLEVGRQHAHDTVRFAVDPDVPAHDVPAGAVVGRPQRVRENHVLVRLRLRLIVRETTAQERLSPER